jgi:hypothetical protein
MFDHARGRNQIGCLVGPRRSDAPESPWRGCGQGRARRNKGLLTAAAKATSLQLRSCWSRTSECIAVGPGSSPVSWPTISSHRPSQAGNYASSGNRADQVRELDRLVYTFGRTSFANRSSVSRATTRVSVVMSKQNSVAPASRNRRRASMMSCGRPSVGACPSRGEVS